MLDKEYADAGSTQAPVTFSATNIESISYTYNIYITGEGLYDSYGMHACVVLRMVG